MLFCQPILQVEPSGTHSPPVIYYGATITWSEPVIIHGSWNTTWNGQPLRVDGNESIGLDSYYALTDSVLFGQYENHLQGGRVPFVVSTDSGRSWGFSQYINTTGALESAAAAYGEQALTGKGRRPAKYLRTLGRLHIGPNGTVEPPPPWRDLSSQGFLEFSVSDSGGLHIDTSHACSPCTAVSFYGLPRPMVGSKPNWGCMRPGTPGDSACSNHLCPLRFSTSSDLQRVCFQRRFGNPSQAPFCLMVLSSRPRSCALRTRQQFHSTPT